MAARALAYLGKDYNLLFFNCEHVANLAANGQAESKQVQRGVIMTVLVSLGVIIANENGTTVDGNGTRRDNRGRYAARRWW